MQTFTIRHEEPSDLARIYEINQSAFDSHVQPMIVDKIRESGCPRISLVAMQDNEVIGHIMFSPVTVSGSAVKACQLSPVAVRPALQGGGCGSLLINHGLALCADQWDAVFLVGNPLYYSRFGFEMAKPHGFTSDEFSDFLQMLALKPGALKDVSGHVVFHPAFAGG